MCDNVVKAERTLCGTLFPSSHYISGYLRFQLIERAELPLGTDKSAKAHIDVFAVKVAAVADYVSLGKRSVNSADCGLDPYIRDRGKHPSAHVCVCAVYAVSRDKLSLREILIYRREVYRASDVIAVRDRRIYEIRRAEKLICRRDITVQQQLSYAARGNRFAVQLYAVNNLNAESEAFSEADELLRAAGSILSESEIIAAAYIGCVHSLVKYARCKFLAR